MVGAFGDLGVLGVISFLLTVAGLCLAASAILPLSEVASLAPTPRIKRAWQILALIIFVCVVLQFVATITNLHREAGLGDVLAASVHLLGPAFVLAIAWLSRRTAHDLVRVADLERAALIDPLTGLRNRRHFDIRLVEEIQTSRRSGQALNLVLLDVDYFKRVNDTFGHGAGDLVLKQVAQLIASAIRSTDIAWRIGGEEFALILSNLTRVQATAVIERLRLTIESAAFCLAEGGTTRVTASLGAAILEEYDSSETFVERADAALYAAKRAGRNRVSLAAQLGVRSILRQ